MPFGDRTGPAGLGPRTGRGAGFCGGFGGGGGRGRQNWFRATGLTGWQRASRWPWGVGSAAGTPYAGASREEELGALKEQTGYLENALAGISKRIDALEAKGKPD